MKDVFLFVQIGDGDLEKGSEQTPKEVRHVRVYHPSHMWPDSDERPNERCGDKEYVNGRECIVFESELNWRKGEVEE